MTAPVYARSATPNVWLSANVAGAAVSAGKTAQSQVNVNASNVTVTGNAADNTYVVLNGSDQIVEAAGGGVETVTTYSSGYTLSANLENLFLMGTGPATGTGNSGDNMIVAKYGDDRLITGGGNDLLVSGTGANVFVPTKDSGTTTWITGFKTAGAKTDQLELLGYGFQGFAAVQSKMTQIGADLRIDLGNAQYVMIENMKLGDITAANIAVEPAPAPVAAPVPTTAPVTIQIAAPGFVMPAPNAPLSGLKMTFDEEFNSLSLRTGTAATAGGLWKTSDGWGNRTLSGNGELQLYVDADYKGLGLNPFSINTGVLDIHASKVVDPAIKAALGGYNYVSGELTTAGSFAQQYGYFEMRAQMAGGQGMWPAFWMLAADKSWPPEIDIVEAVGKDPNYVYTTLHSKDGNSGKANWSTTDISKDFHTYGVDWTASTITFYFDGKAVYAHATPSDMNKPMYMLLNLAVGGSWPGSPDSTTDWSKTDYLIDYVRVWSHDQNALVYSNVPAAPVAPAVTLTNATNALDLTGGFAAAATGMGTSTTYNAAQTGVAGLDPTANVTVAYDSYNGVTVTNNAAWNAIKNAVVTSPSNGVVTVNNFVDAEITLGGTGASNVTATQAKRGTITTGAGDDTVSVSAYSNGTTDNVMTIATGAGNDTITFGGASNTRTAITAGDGADTIRITGQAGGTMNAGAGADRIIDQSTGALTLTGGADADVFEFMAGAHATITDFQAGIDSIVLRGVSASNVHVTSVGGNTLTDLGGGASVNLVGATLLAGSPSLSYAA